MTESAIALVGVVIGGCLAAGGQYLMARTNDTAERTQALRQAVATFAALEHDFRNRLWEERNGLATDRVEQWDTLGSRLSAMTLRLITSDEGLLRAEKALTRAGQALGQQWRLSRGDDAVIDAAWEAHRSALDSFITAAVKLGPTEAPFGSPDRNEDPLARSADQCTCPTAIRHRRPTTASAKCDAARMIPRSDRSGRLYGGVTHPSRVRSGWLRDRIEAKLRPQARDSRCLVRLVADRIHHTPALGTATALLNDAALRPVMLQFDPAVR